MEESKMHSAPRLAEKSRNHPMSKIVRHFTFNNQVNTPKKLTSIEDPFASTSTEEENGNERDKEFTLNTNKNEKENEGEETSDSVSETTSDFEKNPEDDISPARYTNLEPKRILSVEDLKNDQNYEEKLKIQGIDSTLLTNFVISPEEIEEIEDEKMTFDYLLAQMQMMEDSKD